MKDLTMAKNLFNQLDYKIRYEKNKNANVNDHFTQKGRKNLIHKDPPYEFFDIFVKILLKIQKFSLAPHHSATENTPLVATLSEV